MTFKALQDALQKVGFTQSVSETKERKKGARLKKKGKANIPKSANKQKPPKKDKNKKNKPQKTKDGKLLVKVPKGFSYNTFQKDQSEENIKKSNSVEIIGNLELHPLILETGEENTPLRVQHSSNKSNIYNEIIEVADLVIGLDFGTSSTKVVMRDVSLDKAFAVPFYLNKLGYENYLFPSHLFKQGASYSLDTGDKCIQDLKIRIMNTDAEDLESFVQSSIYLALIIRHCRGWLFENFKNRYNSTEIWWKLNLGLPAKHYEDTLLVERFEKLAWCAEYLALNGSVLLTDIDAKNALEFWKNKKDIIDTEIDVVPEIAAQIFGYVRSGHWDPKGNSMMMMVDIGAGTLDAAFFSISQDHDKNLTYSFMGVEVKPFGVMNLHRARIEWLLKLFDGISNFLNLMIKNLKQCAIPTDRLDAIPEDVRDYVRGIRYNIVDNDDFIDEWFIKQVPLLINRCTMPTVIKLPSPEKKSRWETPKHYFSLFLCGGGGRMAFFKEKIIEYTNQHSVPFRFNQKYLPVPTDLNVNSTDRNYDRLSVAYGLSWHMAGEKPLGEFVRSLELPEETKEVNVGNYEDFYISKDMM